jgi:hypothetical protein
VRDAPYSNTAHRSLQQIIYKNAEIPGCGLFGAGKSRKTRKKRLKIPKKASGASLYGDLSAQKAEKLFFLTKYPL